MSRTVPESNPRTPVTPRRGVALALAFALLLAAGGRAPAQDEPDNPLHTLSLIHI